MDISALQPLPDFSWHKTSTRDIDQRYFHFYNIDFPESFKEQLHHHFGGMNLASYRIAVHYFSLPMNDKTVVLVHGYFDHVGLYGHLIKMLLTLGFNVLAYDLPGHGLSTGEAAGINSFSEYQLVLKALLREANVHIQPPIYIVGQSTGGSIAMDYVMNNPQHGFSKMVLLAPLVIPRHWVWLKSVLLIFGRFIPALPRDFSKNSHDQAFLHFIKKQDPLQARQAKRSWGLALLHWQKHFQQSPSSPLPTLLLQGDHDKTVDWRYDIQEIQKKFTNLTVAKLQGARHHLANESTIYREKIYADIKEFLLSK
jgi:alpha-beta hydrolase superfamily lysophospholipase